MEQSIGRDVAPTTEANGPDAHEPDHEPDAHRPDHGADAHLLDAEIQRRIRDMPPAAMRVDTGLTDLDALQRSADPLDPRRPRRPTNDPLDPDVF